MAEATHYIGYWLAKNHLFTQELARWVVKAQGVLHVDFENRVSHFLRNKSADEIRANPVYIKFWDILLHAPRVENIHFFYRGLTFLAFCGAAAKTKQRIVLRTLTPGVSVGSPWRFDRKDDDPLKGISDLATFSIKVDEETCIEIWRDISGEERSRDFLSGLTDDITSRLLEALRLNDYVERFYVKEYSDHAIEAVHVPELERRDEHLAIIVLFCLEACRADIRAGKVAEVRSIVERWRSLWQETGYELLCRIVLSLSSEHDACDIGLVVSMLLADNANVMRRHSCRREIFRFFRLQGHQMSAEQTSEIVSALNRINEDSEE